MLRNVTTGPWVRMLHRRSSSLLYMPSSMLRGCYHLVRPLRGVLRSMLRVMDPLSARRCTEQTGPCSANTSAKAEQNAAQAPVFSANPTTAPKPLGSPRRGANYPHAASRGV